MNTIEKLNHSIDFQNLTYYYKGSTTNVNYNDFINVATLFDEIKSNRIKLAHSKINEILINTE